MASRIRVSATAALHEPDPPPGLPRSSYHGVLCEPGWAPPSCVFHSDAEARPGYETRSCSEYVDSVDVIAAKVRIVASLIRAHRGSVLVYAGAGLSTAAGIGDYGSRKSEGSIAPHKKRISTENRLGASPTASHHIMAALHRRGLIDHIVNQNHDRLPQKAGFPQDCINEIHGAWGDKKNPVVMMDGALRADLLRWMDEWRSKARICIAVGTSMCGMHADSVPEAIAARGGLVIVNLQQTRFDSSSAVRVWGLADDFFRLLFKELIGTVAPSIVKSDLVSSSSRCDASLCDPVRAFKVPVGRERASYTGKKSYSTTANSSAAASDPTAQPTDHPGRSACEFRRALITPRYVDPVCKAMGESWLRRHPKLLYDTPTRK